MNVDVDHPLRGQVVLVDEAPHLHDPRVVDEDVERAELRLGAVEEGREGLPARHVERERDDAGPELLRRGSRRLGVDVADRDSHALSQ